MARYPKDAGPEARKRIKAMQEEMFISNFDLRMATKRIPELEAENARMKEMLDGWHQREQARLASELVMGIEAERLGDIAFLIYENGVKDMSLPHPDERAILRAAVAIDLKVALARKCERLVLQIRYPQPDHGEPT